VDLALFIKGVL